MALTDNCDLYASLDEKGINLVVEHLMRKRPSLFNYASKWLATGLNANPPALTDDRFVCSPIVVAPEVIEKKAHVISPENGLPLLGSSPLINLEYLFQVTELLVDFHPGNVLQLPAGLDPPLKEQHLAIETRVCFGLFIRIPPDDAAPPPPAMAAIPARRLFCVCLRFFLAAQVDIEGGKGQQDLVISPTGIQVADVTPDELGNVLEQYINLLLHHVLFPKISTALKSILLEIDLVGLAKITPYASTQVANNPAVESDKLKLFVNLEVKK